MLLYTLHTANFFIYTAHCTLSTKNCTLNTTHSPLQTAKYTMHSVIHSYRGKLSAFTMTTIKIGNKAQAIGAELL